MGVIKNVVLFGGGIAVLVYLATSFQPGKNSKGSLNTRSAAIPDRPLTDNQVPVMGTTRIETRNGKMYNVKYEWKRVEK